MGTKHYDENSVIRSLSRKGCSFNYPMSNITIPKNTLGIHSWGKIDYLVKCGWTYHMAGGKGTVVASSDSKSIREERKEKKQHQLKTKKR